MNYDASSIMRAWAFCAAAGEASAMAEDGSTPVGASFRLTPSCGPAMARRPTFRSVPISDVSRCSNVRDGRCAHIRALKARPAIPGHRAHPSPSARSPNLCSTALPRVTIQRLKFPYALQTNWPLARVGPAGLLPRRVAKTPNSLYSESWKSSWTPPDVGHP